jgi:hypothetical protein
VIIGFLRSQNGRTLGISLENIKEAGKGKGECKGKVVRALSLTEHHTMMAYWENVEV